MQVLREVTFYCGLYSYIYQMHSFYSQANDHLLLFKCIKVNFLCIIITMYKYDFSKMTDTDLIYVGTANFLMMFFVLFTGFLFNIFGFQVGFSGINFLFGLPYYFYIFFFTRTIISFVFRHFCYKKHSFFDNKKKYVIDTLVFVLFLVAFFLHAYFVITATSDNESFVVINWDYRLLIPVLLPLYFIFMIYLDFTAHKPIRMKNKAFWQAYKDAKKSKNNNL